MCNSLEASLERTVLKKTLTFVVALLAVGLWSVPAQASTIDLTTSGTSGQLTGTTGGKAWFIQAGSVIVSGTGVFPSFVQVQAHGNSTTEAAYNTTVNNVMDNGSADPHNHAIQKKDLKVVVKDGLKYFEFILDINEAKNGVDNYLSLNDLVIKSSPTANQSAGSIGALSGTTIWDMAGSDVVLLNYGLVSSGSGRPDMTFLVPVKAFAGVKNNDFIYLYSQFGLSGKVLGLNSKGKTVVVKDFGASAGFEEWAMGQSGARVPDQGLTVALLGIALVGLAFVGRTFMS